MLCYNKKKANKWRIINRVIEEMTAQRGENCGWHEVLFSAAKNNTLLYKCLSFLRSFCLAHRHTLASIIAEKEPVIVFKPLPDFLESLTTLAIWEVIITKVSQRIHCPLYYWKQSPSTPPPQQKKKNCKCIVNQKASKSRTMAGISVLYHHTHVLSQVFVVSCVVSHSACTLRNAAVDGEGCERENNADTALSPVMAPQAPCFSRFLCLASLSFITGHDGLHQLILTEQQTFTSVHFSLLPYFSDCFSVHLYIMLQFLYVCSILPWFCEVWQKIDAVVQRQCSCKSSIHHHENNYVRTTIVKEI